MKLTIGEIARQAAVSKGTVSRVINGKSTVAKATRQNVLAVMKRLGYEPDPVARELSMRTKHTLGIWVGSEAHRLSPYFNLVWRALLKEIQLRATQFVELPVDLTSFRRTLDAVLLFDCIDIDSRLGALERRRIPAVMIGHHPAIPCVAPDDPGGGSLAASHLLARGHRRLLQLTVAGVPWAEARARGFEEALEACGIAGLDVGRLQGEPSVLGGYRLMRDAWKRGQRPTGVFCATDEMAIGALGALEDLGVPVPDAVSIIGFDGLTELCPGLASIAQDIPAIAHEAVSLALAAIKRNSVRHTIVPVKFLDGTTLGPAPGPHTSF